MTIVEFFDKNDIENIVNLIEFEPEKIIFVGDKKKKIEQAIARYTIIAEKRNIKVQFEPNGLPKNNLSVIVDKLTDIVNENEQCIFDLSGGETLYLVAVGIVAQKYPDKVRLHKFNITSGQLYDYDMNESKSEAKEVEISIEENICAYGGKIIYESDRPGATYKWNFDEDFIVDIKKMWEICRRDPSRWNAQMNTLDKVSVCFENESTLRISFDKEEAKEIIKKQGNAFVFIPGMLKALDDKGVIKELQMDDGVVSFEFKNEQVKRCLTKAGQLLELFVAVKALSCKDKDGKQLYHDVQVGVVIDWDGEVDTTKPNVENEVDVILQKDLIPIFISCKNGALDVNELYKLNSVADEFGGKYAKKVLVATELDKMHMRGEVIRARANELGIRVIKDIDNKGSQEIERELKSLWCN